MGKSLKNIVLGLVELFRPHLEGISSIIDIGTGTSIPIHVFAESFPGIYYHTTDIEDIRKRKDLPFTIYDGKNLPFRNSEFDISLLNETLHHCEDPESVLKEAGRVSKSIFIIEHFPLENADTKELFSTELSALKEFGLECKYYRPFSEKTLNQLLKKTALRVLYKQEIPYHGKRKIKKYLFKVK